MKRAVAIIAGALVLGVAAVVFWPNEREPIVVDGTTYLVDEMGIQTHLGSSEKTFFFAMEPESGRLEINGDEVLQIVSRVFCHLKNFERTKDDLASSSKAAIYIRVYDWKVGRFGKWRDNGGTIDVAKATCSQMATG